MRNTAGLYKFQRAPLPVSGQASVSMSCYFLAFAVLDSTGGWPCPQSVNATPEMGATMDMAGNGAAVWEKSLTGDRVSPILLVAGHVAI